MGLIVKIITESKKKKKRLIIKETRRINGQQICSKERLKNGLQVEGK